ncbi:MAG: HNH endonuclease, partial [Candidatus Krumholzibacteriia bacterium]
RTPSREALFGRGGAVPADAPPSDAPLHVTLRFTPAQYARWAAQLERARKLAGRGCRVLPGAPGREELLLAALDELVAAADRDLATMRATGAVPAPLAGTTPWPAADASPLTAATAVAPSASGAAAPGAAGAAGTTGARLPETRRTAPTAAPPEPRGSPYQIILFRCSECGGTRIQTPLGPRMLAPPAAAAAACDARVLTPEGRNVATIPPAVRRGILARDRYRCRAPGCGATRFLEVHHRVPRARGGTNRPDNLVTLCAACHRRRHESSPPPLPDGGEAG